MQKGEEMKYCTRVWVKVVELVFPGTYEEYLEAKSIHKKEIKVYRRNPQFIAGLLLYAAPLVAVFCLSPEWKLRLMIVFIVIGEILIRDSMSEHYCALINRERKNI